MDFQKKNILLNVAVTSKEDLFHVLRIMPMNQGSLPMQQIHVRHSLNGKHNIQPAYKKALLFHMQKLNPFWNRPFCLFV